MDCVIKAIIVAVIILVIGLGLSFWLNNGSNEQDKMSCCGEQNSISCVSMNAGPVKCYTDRDDCYDKCGACGAPFDAGCVGACDIAFGRCLRNDLNKKK